MLVEKEVKEKLVKWLRITLREVDQVDDKKADGGIVYKQILINAILQIGKRSTKTELSGRSLLRRRRSALGCSVI